LNQCVCTRQATRFEIFLLQKAIETLQSGDGKTGGFGMRHREALTTDGNRPQVTGDRQKESRERRRQAVARRLLQENQIRDSRCGPRMMTCTDSERNTRAATCRRKQALREGCAPLGESSAWAFARPAININVVLPWAPSG